jgi:hypothetical protein
VTALAPNGRDPCVLDLNSISMADRAATAAPDATRRWRHEALRRRFGYTVVVASMEVSWRRLQRDGGASGISPPELFPGRQRKGAAAADTSPPDLGRGGRLQLKNLRLASSLARLSPPSLSWRTARVVVEVEVASPLSLPIGQGELSRHDGRSSRSRGVAAGPTRGGGGKRVDSGREMRIAGDGCSGEDDGVSSPVENTRSSYHLVQFTKHEHSKSGYI